MLGVMFAQMMLMNMVGTLASGFGWSDLGGLHPTRVQRTLTSELHTRWNYRDQNGRIESNEIFENYLF